MNDGETQPEINNALLKMRLNDTKTISPKVRAEQVWKAFLDYIDEQDEIMWSQNMNNAIQLYLDADSM